MPGVSQGLDSSLISFLVYLRIGACLFITSEIQVWKFSKTVLMLVTSDSQYRTSDQFAFWSSAISASLLGLE